MKRRVKARMRMRQLALLSVVGLLAASAVVPVATTSAGATGNGPAILNTVLKDESEAKKKGNSWFQSLHTVIDRIRKPATIALGAVVPLTLIVGGGILAMGIRRGMQLIAIAVGAGALVLLGNGLAA